MSKQLYTTEIGEGEIVVYSDEAIILNAYVENTAQYEVFDGTLSAMAIFGAINIDEIELNDTACERVRAMIEANYGKTTYSNKDIVDFLLSHK